MYYNCIDGGKDRSVRLIWADAPCVNCGFVVDTPTFSIEPAFVVDEPTFEITPVSTVVASIVLDPSASPIALWPSYHQLVYLSTATEGASIYYTLDGSDPTEFSTLWDGTPISIFSIPVLIKARAYKSGLDPSEIYTQLVTYAIDAGYVNTGFWSRITPEADPIITEWSTYVTSGTGYFFPVVVTAAPPNPTIVNFDLTPGSINIRNIVIESILQTPLAFFEDTGSVVPITLLGPIDGFNLVDANGNPYKEFTDTGTNFRHYACAPSDGLTYGFNVKITF
jgi:hypothetical protein